MRKRTEFGWMELILGIILTILGIFTMIRPESMLNSIVICYGIVAAVSGIADIIFYVKMERHMGVVPTGILSTLLGMMLILCPGAAQRLVIWLFALWIIMHSISRLSHISTVRYFAGNSFGLVSLLLNIIGIVIGIMLLIEPIMAVVAFGYLIGLYLIVLGIDSIASALSKMGSDW